MRSSCSSFWGPLAINVKGCKRKWVWVAALQGSSSCLRLLQGLSSDGSVDTKGPRASALRVWKSNWYVSVKLWGRIRWKQSNIFFLRYMSWTIRTLFVSSTPLRRCVTRWRWFVLVRDQLELFGTGLGMGSSWALNVALLAYDLLDLTSCSEALRCGRCIQLRFGDVGWV